MKQLEEEIKVLIFHFCFCFFFILQNPFSSSISLSIFPSIEPLSPLSLSLSLFSSLFRAAGVYPSRNGWSYEPKSALYESERKAEVSFSPAYLVFSFCFSSSLSPCLSLSLYLYLSIYLFINIYLYIYISLS